MKFRTYRNRVQTAEYFEFSADGNKHKLLLAQRSPESNKWEMLPWPFMLTNLIKSQISSAYRENRGLVVRFDNEPLTFSLLAAAQWIVWFSENIALHQETITER